MQDLDRAEVNFRRARRRWQARSDLGLPRPDHSPDEVDVARRDKPWTVDVAEDDKPELPPPSQERLQ